MFLFQIFSPVEGQVLVLNRARTVVEDGEALIAQTITNADIPARSNVNMAKALHRLAVRERVCSAPAQHDSKDWIITKNNKRLYSQPF